MNMKTIIAAFAVAAATVASAGTFRWTLTPGTGSDGNGIAYSDWTEAWYGVNSGNKDNTFSKKEFTQVGDSYYIDIDFGTRENGDLFKFGYNGADNKGWADTGSQNPTGGNYQGTIKWTDILNATNNGGTFKGKFEGTNSGTFTLQAIPEPTSGLMLLLGAGMLALRRKAVRA